MACRNSCKRLCVCFLDDSELLFFVYSPPAGCQRLLCQCWSSWTRRTSSCRRR